MSLVETLDRTPTPGDERANITDNWGDRLQNKYNGHQFHRQPTRYVVEDPLKCGGNDVGFLRYVDALVIQDLHHRWWNPAIVGRTSHSLAKKVKTRKTHIL